MTKMDMFYKVNKNILLFALLFFLFFLYTLFDPELVMNIVGYVSAVIAVTLVLIFVIKSSILKSDINNENVKEEYIMIKKVYHLKGSLGFRHKYELEFYGLKIVSYKGSFYYFYNETKDSKKIKTYKQSNKKIKIVYYKRSKVIKDILTNGF